MCPKNDPYLNDYIIYINIQDLGTFIAIFRDMETIIEDVMADYFKGILQRESRRKTAESQPLPSLEDLVEDYVCYVLWIASNNIAFTARILKISRSALYHRLRRGGHRNFRSSSILGGLEEEEEGKRAKFQSPPSCPGDGQAAMTTGLTISAGREFLSSASC
jgi:hypothetical protein